MLLDFEEARLASRFRLLPNNASAHRGKAKTAHSAVPHGLLATAASRNVVLKDFLRFALSRPASRNKSDKAAADFVSERTR